MDDYYSTAVSSAPQTLRCQACGREFAQSNAYSTHVGSCRPQKKRMASALDTAQELYRRKKARLNHDLVETQVPQSLDLHTAAAEPAETEVSGLHVSQLQHFLIYAFFRYILL